MKVTIPSTILIVFMLLFSGCKQSPDAIFNGKDLSNWGFVVEDNAVPAEEVYMVDNGIIRIMGEPLGYMYTKKKYQIGRASCRERV
mgnify:CR=1 FL=1